LNWVAVLIESAGEGNNGRRVERLETAEKNETGPQIPFSQVIYAKLLEKPFFVLPISFRELANYYKCQIKNGKLLEML